MDAKRTTGNEIRRLAVWTHLFRVTALGKTGSCWPFVTQCLSLGMLAILLLLMTSCAAEPQQLDLSPTMTVSAATELLEQSPVKTTPTLQEVQEDPSEAQAEAENNSKLANYEWYLTSPGLGDEIRIFFVPGSPLSRFYGTGVCEGYWGELEMMEDGRIEAFKVTHTGIDCDTDYLSTLKSITSYRIHEDEPIASWMEPRLSLELQDDSGETILAYEQTRSFQQYSEMVKGWWGWQLHTFNGVSLESNQFVQLMFVDDHLAVVTTPCSDYILEYEIIPGWIDFLQIAPVREECSSNDDFGVKNSQFIELLSQSERLNVLEGGARVLYTADGDMLDFLETWDLPEAMREPETLEQTTWKLDAFVKLGGKNRDISSRLQVDRNKYEGEIFLSFGDEIYFGVTECGKYTGPYRAKRIFPLLSEDGKCSPPAGGLLQSERYIDFLRSASDDPSYVHIYAGQLWLEAKSGNTLVFSLADPEVVVESSPQTEKQISHYTSSIVFEETQVPPIQPSVERIAFFFTEKLHGRPSDFDLGIVNPDGTGYLCFICDSAFVRESMLRDLTGSPDGQQIAFVGNDFEPDQSSLYVANLDTGRIIRIDLYTPVNFLAWSPDSQRLAYTNYQGEVNIIYLENLTETMVANHRANSLSWLDDSMLFFTDEDGGHTISILDASGTPTDDIFPHAEQGWYFALSPDGEILATNSGGRILLIEKDGKTRYIDCNCGGGEINELSWSPDGQLIAMTAASAPSDAPDVTFADGSGITIPNINILVADLKDDSIQVVVANDGQNHSPAWSPDSQEIVFSSDMNGSRQLYILEIETGDVRQLGDFHDLTLLNPVWSP
jgi:Tol biopolymer transport system component